MQRVGHEGPPDPLTPRYCLGPRRGGGTEQEGRESPTYQGSVAAYAAGGGAPKVPSRSDPPTFVLRSPTPLGGGHGSAETPCSYFPLPFPATSPESAPPSTRVPRATVEALGTRARVSGRLCQGPGPARRRRPSGLTGRGMDAGGDGPGSRPPSVRSPTPAPRWCDGPGNAPGLALFAPRLRLPYVDLELLTPPARRPARRARHAPPRPRHERAGAAPCETATRGGGGGCRATRWGRVQSARRAGGGGGRRGTRAQGEVPAQEGEAQRRVPARGTGGPQVLAGRVERRGDPQGLEGRTRDRGGA